MLKLGLSQQPNPALQGGPRQEGRGSRNRTGGTARSQLTVKLAGAGGGGGAGQASEAAAGPWAALERGGTTQTWDRPKL